MEQDTKILEQRIVSAITDYWNHKNNIQEFIPGKTIIPASRAVGDHEEVINATFATLNFPWLTEGKYARLFEKDFKKFLNTRSVSLTNSGSSANLIAISALTSYKISEIGRSPILPNDEIITTASCFPTSANAIALSKAIPVFVDVDLDTLNPNPETIEAAVTDRTKAILITHALGNPCDMDPIMDIAKRHNLFVIEDTCDALGSTYKGKQVGTFGDFGTYSFYPAHTMTMGEGGATVTKSPFLERIARSFRDWGRDCWCDTGEDNTCGLRFAQQFGDLPFGYDHKFVYTHLGYNLKLTDIQAAIGLAQLKKLPGFIEDRKNNFQQLYKGLEQLQDSLTFISPQPDSEPAWYGFPITVKPEAKFSKNDLVSYIENAKILTRTASLGNIARQPYFQNIPHRIYSELTTSNYILENTFWIAVYPGLTPEVIEYITSTCSKFFK